VALATERHLQFLAIGSLTSFCEYETKPSSFHHFIDDLRTGVAGDRSNNDDNAAGWILDPNIQSKQLKPELWQFVMRLETRVAVTIINRLLPTMTTLECAWKPNWEETKRHFVDWWDHEGLVIGSLISVTNANPKDF